MEHITFFQSIPPATEKKKKKFLSPGGEGSMGYGWEQ